MVWLSEAVGTAEWKCLQKCQTSYWKSKWQSNWNLLCQTHTWLVNSWSLFKNDAACNVWIWGCNLWMWTLQYLWYLLYWTVSVLLSQCKQFIWVNHMSYIAHTLIWLTVSFVLPNHKQFIRVNRMLYITHTFIWLPVSFVPTHQKRLIELNCMPWIAHATNIWTVFDASVITNVLHHFDFFTPPFAIIASHTVSSKGLWS